jgi:predicted nuclease of predicted toxin-antitoxin system
MSLQIVVDLSLSPPHWVTLLTAQGWHAVHWSTVGVPTAPDTVIMSWARTHSFVVFTNDLDFATILALTHAAGPSVIQMRTQDVLPDQAGARVVSAIRQHEADLLTGAIVVIDEARLRTRILPL